MPTISRESVARCIAAALLSVSFVCAQVSHQSRLSGPLDFSRRVQLRGHLRPELREARDLGALAGGHRVAGVQIMLAPSAEQAAELEQFVEDQRNPASPDYQNWLTPEQFADRFGATAADYARVADWLTGEGLQVEGRARARNWISVQGTAAQLARTFGTQLHRVEAGGEVHIANLSEPSVPVALAEMVSGIRGLDDFRPKPMRVIRPTVVNPEMTNSSGSHYLAPDDLAMIYNIAPLYKAGYDGTGQKIVIPGQTAINLSDIRSFRNQFALPANDPQVILAGADPGIRSGDQVEANLDLEWAGAVARNAKVIYVYSQNVFTSIQYALDQNLAPVISLSYGGCESPGVAGYRSMALQANAQGITWLNSSGDQGAAGCDYGASIATHGPSVIFPADIPEVTAVGGTEFAEVGTTSWTSTNSTGLMSATGYIPERGWNDTGASGIWSSGGGVSTVFSKPWWQTGPGVPTDKFRDVPDISLTASGAHDGYLIYSGGLMSVGGTSASSPAFAGIISILNQYLVSKGSLSKSGLGNINPNLYSLAQSTPAIFHDITTGDNIAPCTKGSTGCTTGSFGYTAGPGYDLVTGLGSVNAFNLVTMWSGQNAGVGTTMTVTAAPAAIAPSASTVLTAKVSAVSGTTVPSGTVSFSVSGTVVGTGTVNSTGTATATVKGTALPAGSSTVQASFAPSGAFGASSATVVVTVNAPVSTTISVSASPSTIPQNLSTVLSATVSPALALGTITFSLGNTVLGTTSFTGAAANLTVPGSKLALGANRITAAIAPSGNTYGASVSSPVTVTVNSVLITTTTTVTAAPSTLAQGASTTITAKVRAEGSATPTGSVTFSSGTTALGTATLSGGVATFTLKAGSVGNLVITASYGAGSSFGGSSGTVNLTVTAPPSTTTMTLAASSASLANSASAVLTATVKPSTATGSVDFTLGKTTLCTVAISTGTAPCTVKGSALVTGANTITATLNPSGNYTTASATTTLMLQAPLVSTTTTAVPGVTSILATGSTAVSINVKAATGSASPTGTVQLLGPSGATLGTLALSGGAASITLAGTNLGVGSNSLTAVYLPGAGFDGSSAKFTITVTTPPASNGVVATATAGSQAATGLNVALQLQDFSGLSSKITAMSINGSNFTPAITAFFGTNQLAAKGKLNAALQVQWNPMPASIVFSITGIDTSGHTWTQNISMLTAK